MYTKQGILEFANDAINKFGRLVRNVFSATESNVFGARFGRYTVSEVSGVDRELDSQLLSEFPDIHVRLARMSFLLLEVVAQLDEIALLAVESFRDSEGDFNERCAELYKKQQEIYTGLTPIRELIAKEYGELFEAYKRAKDATPTADVVLH